MYFCASIFIMLMSTVWAQPGALQFQNDRTIGEAGKDTVDSLIKLNKRAICCGAPLGTDKLLKGLQVVRHLLRGTKEISAVGPIREFEKGGGLIQALADFSKVSRTEVKEFRTSNGAIVKQTIIGDRKIVLTNRNADGMPSIEITKFRNLDTRRKGQILDMPDQLRTDKIFYTKALPMDHWD